MDKKVVIVLDQFEQWLHAKKEETNTELVRALRQCNGVGLQCIVMVRDDFWLAVSRFLRDLETRLVEGQNSALVDLFDLDHARNTKSPAVDPTGAAGVPDRVIRGGSWRYPAENCASVGPGRVPAGDRSTTFFVTFLCRRSCAGITMASQVLHVLPRAVVLPRNAAVYELT